MAKKYNKNRKRTNNIIKIDNNIDNKVDEIENIEENISDDVEDITEEKKTVEPQVMEEDNREEDTGFLDDEDALDMGELQSLIEEMEDIKPYEERTVKKRSYNEKKSLVLNFDRKMILLIAVLVLSVGLLAALIFDTTTSKKSKNDVNSYELEEVTNNTIITLINNYFDAVEKCDMTALKSLVDNTDNISQDKLELESEYIEDYQNIKMYYVKGINSNEYVLFISFDNKILNIDTLAPGGMMLYVFKDGNEYKIKTGISKDEKVVDYIKELSENKDIVEFNDDINERLKEACKTDKNLAAFINAITPTTNSEDTTKNTAEGETTQPQETTEETTKKSEKETTKKSEKETTKKSEKETTKASEKETTTKNK